VTAFMVLDADGVELRRGNCPDSMVALQADAARGETAIRWSPTEDDPIQFRLGEDRILVPYEAPVDPVAKAASEWETIKAELAATIAAGFPSTYGPVDLRDGAKAAMMASLTLGLGMDLILLDNRIVALGADDLRALFGQAIAWEQAQIMAAQAQRPAILQSDEAA